MGHWIRQLFKKYQGGRWDLGTRKGRVLAATPGLILLLAVGLVQALPESAWSDDYELLTKRIGVGGYQRNLAEGRPLAVLVQAPISLMSSTQQLVILRLLGVGGLLILYCVILRVLPQRTTAGLQMGQGIVLATSILIPSLQISTYFATAWFACFAYAISVLCWLAWSNRAWKYKLAALVSLGILGTAVAQAVFFPLAICALLLALSPRKTSDGFRVIAFTAMLVIGSALISLLVGFAFRLITDTPSGSRIGLIQPAEVPEKVIWFITRPITTSLRPFLTDRPSMSAAALTAVPIALLLVLITAALARRAQVSPIGNIVLVSIGIVGSGSYLLAWSLNQIEYRLIPGMTFSVLAIILVGAWLLLVDTRTENSRPSPVRRNLMKVSAGLLLIAIPILAVWTSVRSTEELIVIPYANKTMLITSALGRCKPDLTRRIVLSIPDSGFPRKPRIGDFSMATDLQFEWMPEVNARLIAKTLHFEPSVDFVVVPATEVQSREGDCPVHLELLPIS